ncbi:hypothetical protein L2E82_42438 [Cichorium intybus]|uniref:Uncharacterized protein n=1 Tax=Cichorium intybus TaxID=13427 RepID=A0ACB8ZMZ6_CICIN|nr:hypothetical protein L2E82_42438 [Cichorium intybus]
MAGAAAVRLFLRCPVELSVCLETEKPFHAVTSSALMTSMLILSRRTCGWLPEAMTGISEISLLPLVHEKNAKKSGQFDKNMGIRDGLFLAEKGL